jgi:co-chaperonin GroES (HSP10)
MLYPRNRHLSILPEYIERQNKQRDSTILLPEDYSKVESRYCAASVVNVSSDCNLDVLAGDRILVDRSMIEEVEYDGETNYLILANYVIAEIGDNT